MNQLSAIYFLILILLLTACSSTQQISVHHLDESITVDGSLSDWNTTDALLKETDNIRYFAAIHDEFLHLFIDVRSPFKENTIRQLGMIVYLSNSESDRKNVGIAYPPGTFNLLRDNPGAFNSFLTDQEWGQNPENLELMNALSEDLFSRVMIVERPNGSDAEYGFVEFSRLEIDGFEIYADEERSRMSIEMRIPINDSSIFNLRQEDLWVGFSIEPPRFRFRNESDMSATRQQRGGYGQRRPMMRPRSSGQSLPNEEEWFILSFD